MLVVRKIVATVAGRCLATDMAVFFGISASSSRGILLRAFADKISLCLIFHSSAASILAEDDISHQTIGWMSGARLEPLRTRISSPPHHAFPFGALGRTLSNNVSPVQVSVAPLTGLCKDFASEGLPLQQSSIVSNFGHCSPANRGLLTRSTSMFLTSMGGGSAGTSSGLNSVVRGTLCVRTR